MTSKFQIGICRFCNRWILGTWGDTEIEYKLEDGYLYHKKCYERLRKERQEKSLID